MALIKCTECGHEVSDKATICPKCGCPLNSSKPRANASGKSFGKKGAGILLGLLAVGGLGLGAWQWYNSGQAQKQIEMAAPEIATDADGFIWLNQCPTDYPGLKIVLEGEGFGIYKAKVYKDDILLQTLGDDDEDEVLATNIEDIQNPTNVHFLDANFDGLVDLFIGVSQSRSVSSLFLWNPSSEKFVQAGGRSYQGLVLEPSTRSVYEAGAGSAWCFGVTKMQWQYLSLRGTETLERISEPDQYENYDVNRALTLRDADNKVICETDDITQLPGKWGKLLEKYLNTEE